MKIQYTTSKKWLMKNLWKHWLAASGSLLLASLVLARASVPFIGSPVNVTGTSNFMIFTNVFTIPVSQIALTLGSVASSNTVFNGYVCENIGGTNMLVISSYNYVYANSPGGTNGLSTNFPPAWLVCTNYIYLVASTGTNTVPLTGQYGF